MNRFRALSLFLYAVVPGSHPISLAAQTIPIRTVPVASGDQFLILPSSSLSMGGVRLAVDDSLADAWSNPAKGALLTESAFIGSPTYYSISERGGGGRTFPVAGLFAGAEWFGGAALAIQEIEDADPRCCARTRTLSETLGQNVYSSGFLGRRLSGEWSLGLGVSTGRLGAMGGVDLLYAGAERIDQSGVIGDVRLGLYRTGARDRLSLLVLHSRVSMTHKVTYRDSLWDVALMRSVATTRVEVNEDQTRTWGGRVAWDRALDTPGWRIGASGTVNYKNHPKIPNYSLQNIPRDPGTTWAYEAAVGFSRSDGVTTFALDVALQPIWSETWQEANAEDVAASVQRLRPGDRSIENDFFFTNVVIRSGLSHDVGGVDLQVGLEIRSYAYQLEQVNHVERTYREQDESWIEWSPTFGALFRFDALDLRYSGRVTTGTGRPGAGDVARTSGPGEQLLGDGDFILAPDGPLTLQEARVMTHQLSVRIPIR